MKMWNILIFFFILTSGGNYKEIYKKKRLNEKIHIKVYKNFYKKEILITIQKVISQIMQKGTLIFDLYRKNDKKLMI